MIQKFNQYNESIRDEMKPKSKQDVLDKLGELPDMGYESTEESNIGNSSAIGSVITSYDKLVELFGEPNLPDWSWKTNFQWLLKDKDDNYMRIYDWKALESGLKADDIKRVKDFTWMIGGFDQKDAKNLKNYILYNVLTNEGLRDQMAGKSDEEIKKNTDNLTPEGKFTYGNLHEIGWLIKQGLEEGADIHWSDDVALRQACNNGNMEIIKLLLDYGADPFECDYKSIELENRGPKGKEIVELLKQQVKKLYDKQMSESISHNQTVYYNTHGEFAPYSEIRELELERGLTKKDFDEWQTKYDIKDDDLVIWVTKKIRDAYMYLLPASMWNELWEMDDQEAEHLINSEGYTKDDVNVINADGFIIEESDDGDGGFIFVHRK